MAGGTGSICVGRGSGRWPGKDSRRWQRAAGGGSVAEPCALPPAPPHLIVWSGRQGPLPSAWPACRPLPWCCVRCRPVQGAAALEECSTGCLRRCGQAAGHGWHWPIVAQARSREMCPERPRVVGGQPGLLHELCCRPCNPISALLAASGRHRRSPSFLAAELPSRPPSKCCATTSFPLWPGAPAWRRRLPITRRREHVMACGNQPCHRCRRLPLPPLPPGAVAGELCAVGQPTAAGVLPSETAP